MELDAIWQSSLPIADKRRLGRYRVVNAHVAEKQGAKFAGQHILELEKIFSSLGAATGMKYKKAHHLQAFLAKHGRRDLASGVKRVA